MQVFGCRFYSRDIRASAILNGDVEPPSECYDLYHILEAYTEAYTADWTSKNMAAKVNDGVCSQDTALATDLAGVLLPCGKYI